MYIKSVFFIPRLTNKISQLYAVQLRVRTQNLISKRGFDLHELTIPENLCLDATICT